MLALLLRTGAGAHPPLCSVPRLAECDYSVLGCLLYLVCPLDPIGFHARAARPDKSSGTTS